MRSASGRRGCAADAQHPEALIPRSRALRVASRRMAASLCVASILRDASLRDAPQDEVFETRRLRRVSNFCNDRPLQLCDAGFVAFVERPLLDPFGAQQS